MKATDILSSEHRVIERVIAALESASDRLEAGQPVRAGFFLDAADFIKGFADGCHHVKEEGVLFPLMRQGGSPMIAHPIAQMRHEHDEHQQTLAQFRELTQDFVAPADACASWQRLYAELATFCNDLRDHIVLENEVLFPRVLSS